MKNGRVILALTLFLLICFVEPLWAAGSSGQEESEFYSILIDKQDREEDALRMVRGVNHAVIYDSKGEMEAVIIIGENKKKKRLSHPQARPESDNVSHNNSIVISPTGENKEMKGSFQSPEKAGGMEITGRNKINETMEPQEMWGLPAGMSTVRSEKAEGMETTDLPGADRSMIPQDEQELPIGMSTSPSSNQPIGSEMSENVRDKDGNLNDSTIK